MEVDIPSAEVHVLEPRSVAGLPDEEASFRAALSHPIASRPMRELASRTDRLALVIPDITRPLVTDRLLQWILAELSHVAEEQITIINGTGSHRINTKAELTAMLGDGILGRYRVVNHTAHDPATMVPAGKSPDGRTILLNREYVEADRRIVLGFIEPHFMAGFSGGYRGIFT